MIRLRNLTKLICALGNPATFSALSTHVLAPSPNDRIFDRELMPVLTVRFQNVDGRRTDTPENVDTRCDNLDMVRIHAVPVPAKMVAVHPRWNWAVLLLVIPNVSGLLSFFYFNAAIPVLIGCKLPCPTRRHISAVLNNISKRLAAMVIGQEPVRLTLYMPISRVVSDCDVRFVSTPALTVSEGNFRSRIRVHFWSLLQRFRGAVAGGVSAPPGFSLPQFYHFSPCVWGFS